MIVITLADGTRLPDAPTVNAPPEFHFKSPLSVKVRDALVLKSNVPVKASAAVPPKPGSLPTVAFWSRVTVWPLAIMTVSPSTGTTPPAQGALFVVDDQLP